MKGTPNQSSAPLDQFLLIIVVRRGRILLILDLGLRGLFLDGLLRLDTLSLTLWLRRRIVRTLSNIHFGLATLGGSPRGTRFTIGCRLALSRSLDREVCIPNLGEREAELAFGE